MPEPWRTTLVLVAGIGTGVLSGMFGVGGAVASTPAVRVLGATPLESVGSTLPSIFPSAVAGALRYRREGLIRLPVVLWTSLVGAVASVGGAVASGLVPGNGRILMILTAGLVGYTAARMALSPGQPDPADAEPPPPTDAALAIDAGPSGAPRLEWWRLAAVGLGAGLLSGLLGVGGGLLMVPAFVSWVRLPLKEALGNSLACVGILAVPSTIAHQVLGDINWAYALPLSVAVIPGARVGAHLAIRSSDRALRVTVATVLGLIAILYAVGEVVSLLS